MLESPRPPAAISSETLLAESGGLGARSRSNSDKKQPPNPAD